MVGGAKIFADDRGRAAEKHRDRVPFGDGRDVVGVENISRHHLHRQSEVVEGAVLRDLAILGQAPRARRGAGMHVGVDQPRRDQASAGVDFLVDPPAITGFDGDDDAVGDDDVLTRQQARLTRRPSIPRRRGPP